MPMGEVKTQQSSKPDFVPSANQTLSVTWNDLVPTHLTGTDPLQELDPNVRQPIIQMLAILENLPGRGTGNDEFLDQVDNAVKQFEDKGFDLRQLLIKRKQFVTAMVQELDGQKIKILGYLLPLEVSGSSTTEFLLVPYVGACIHSPPPPPNQIIHATVSDKKGYQHKKLFEPVLVTGTLSIKSSTKDLYLVDGSSSVISGYSMQAEIIKPYKE